MSEFDTHESNPDPETVLTEPRVDVRSFSEKHPFLAHLASKWEVYAVGSFCLPYTILGAGFVLFGSGIDPIYPMYNPEGIEVGVALLKLAAICWTGYGIAKGVVASIAPIQRFTQGHFHQHL